MWRSFKTKYWWARHHDLGPVFAAFYATPTWLILLIGGTIGWFLGPIEGFCK